jgi:hypothetical protein
VNGEESDSETNGQQKKRTRLPEKFCINKKKWSAKVSQAEKTAVLCFVPSVYADNSDVHRVLQWKLK